MKHQPDSVATFMRSGRTMKKQTLSTLPLMLLLWTPLHFMGCSLIGLTTGVIADANTPDHEKIQLGSIESIKQGAPLKLIMTADTISGEFMGVEDMPMNEYRARYDSLRTTNMPSLGDFITLTIGARRVEGQLIGFKPQLILLKIKGANNDTSFVGAARVDHVDKLSEKDRSLVEGKTIRKSMEAGGIPFVSSLVLKTRNQTARIPLDKVRDIELTNSKNAALNGLLIGAAIDAGILVALSLLKPFQSNISLHTN
jgi:hypothetical protein